MENASKALIIAGSVLIALMIIGALLLMFNNLSSYQKTGTQGTREAQVIAFNNQYETYNRNNVRGSDLYSLLNRVVDYNRRKSTEGIGPNDEGQYLAYQPMTITCDLGTDLNEFKPQPTGYTSLISRIYTASATTNTFSNTFYEPIKALENDYGAETLNNLVTRFNKIFENSNYEDAIKNFNSACKNRRKIIEIDKAVEEVYDDMVSEHKENVCQYYEYVQFKRAKFNCDTENVRYDQQTGRILEMNFNFSGQFE